MIEIVWRRQYGNLESFCSGNIQNIIASNESLSITVRDVPIDMLFRLLKCDVHVAIETSEYSSIVNARSESNDHFFPDYCFKEICG